MMQTLLRISLDRPRSAFAVAAALTAFFVAGLPASELRTDGDALRPEGNPTVDRDAELRARFRDPRWLLLLAEARAGERLATADGLRRIRSIHDALRALPTLQPEGIRSIASLPRLAADAGGDAGIAIAGWLDDVPDDRAALAALLADIRRHPLTNGLLFSADGRRALFALPVSEAAGVRDAVREVEALAARLGDERVALTVGGPLLAETTLGDRVLADLATLVPVMLVVMALLLALTHRCAAGVAIPLIEAGLVLVWTFGAMAWWGAPIALVTTILPVVLMAMSITDEIHLLERVLAIDPSRSTRERVEEALAQVGRPIVLTSLTTAAGFLSFTSASIGPLREFGAFAAFGILVAMLLTFSLIPALLVTVPAGWLQPARAPAPARVLGALGRIGGERPLWLFLPAAAAFLLVLPGLARLHAGDSWVANFAPDDPLVRMERAVNESFWGTYRLDVVLAGAPGALREPSAVRLVEALREDADRLPYVGGAETYLDVLEPIAETLGAGATLSALGRAELLDTFTVAEMSSGRDALRATLSGDASTTRARLYVKSADYERARALREALDARWRAAPLPAGLSVSYAGDLAVATEMVEAIVDNQLRGVGWALLGVAVLLVVIGGGAQALLAVVPVAATTLGLLAAIGLAGAPLGIATSMFASLTVGVGVDFGIHFAHRYRALGAEGRTHAAAIAGTFDAAGRALSWNAVVLAAGFAVLTLSALRPNHALGLLLAAATLACALTTFLLLPWLLARFGRSAGAAAGIAVALVVAGGTAPARAQTACPVEPDATATALMEDVERHVRTTARITRMHVVTRYRPRESTAPRPEDSTRTLWGVTDGELPETRLLFVFTGPGRMAGTALLMRDRFGSADSDATWLYLRAFDHFQRLTGAVERAVVPGTALTYEDARGFVATDRYHFAGIGSDEAGAVRILACPRTRQIAKRLGYGSLAVRIDPERLLVLAIDYRGLGGGPLKRYALVSTARFEGGERPARVALSQHVEGFDNQIELEYWPLSPPHDASLFEPDVSRSSFLERLRALLHTEGLGARIDAEIEAAETSARAIEEEPLRGAAGD